MAGEASARFALELDSSQLTSAAQAGGSALDNLATKIRDDIVQMREMRATMAALKAGGLESSNAFKKLKDDATALKASIGAAQTQFIEAGGDLRKLKPQKIEIPKIESTTEKLKGFIGEVQAVPGPLSNFGSVASKALSVIGTAGPYVVAAAGMAAVAAASVAAAGAIAIATNKLLQYGLASADVSRTERLRLEGLSKMRNYFLEGFGIRLPTSSVGELGGMIDSVRESVALSRDELVGMQTELYKAGLRGGNLKAALEGMAITAVTQGNEAAHTFKAMALTAGHFGGSIKKISNDVKARLGGLAKAQMLGLDYQIKRVKEDFAQLTSGLKIEGLLEALRKVTEQFNQQHAVGRALKTVYEGIFQPIVDGVASALPEIKMFVIGAMTRLVELQIGAYDIALSIRRVWRRTFGKDGLKIEIDWGPFSAGKLAVDGLAIAFGSLAVAGGLVALTIAGIGLSIAALTFPIWGTVLALGYLGKKALDVFGWFTEKLENLKAYDGASIGLAIIHGIGNGITAGIKWVKDAVNKVGDAITQAFSVRMVMHSPSQLMRKQAINIPKGQAEGIEEGRPIVSRAVARLYDEPVREGQRKRDREDRWASAHVF